MTLYAAVLETEGFTVGQDNSRSGLFRREDDGSWTSLGWPNVRNFGIATTPDSIFLACGNGVLRSGDDGKNWRVTTDWRITEVLDIAVDPTDPHRLVIATAHGIAWSPDDGETWHTNNDGLTATFVQSMAYEPAAPGVPGLPRASEPSVNLNRLRDERATRGPTAVTEAPPGHWIAGTEKGLFEATTCDDRWRSAGLDDIAVRRIAVGSGACAVATDGAGLWMRGSDDWKQVSPLPADASFYAAAISRHGRSIAAGGFRTGVHLSRDGGASWDHLTDGLTNPTVQALSFGPDDNELWAGTSGGGVFRLDGSRWVFEGLPGSTIRKFCFDNLR